TGTGFGANTDLLLDDTSIGQVPGFSMNVIDAYTIAVHRSFAGPGAELDAGDYELYAVDGSQSSSSLWLHVRPILKKLQHVRTLPGLFLKNGGFLDIWSIPT